MIWYLPSKNTWAPHSDLRERVLAQVFGSNPARDVQTKMMEMVSKLTDLSRGANAAYEEIIDLLKETGWSWSGGSVGLPPGLQFLAKANDKLARVMILKRLIPMYELSEYADHIISLEIEKAFGSPRGRGADYGRQEHQRRRIAEQFISQHEQAESGVGPQTARSPGIHIQQRG